MTRNQSDSGPASLKLEELRAKTDQDVSVLLRRALEEGFQLASQGEYAGAETAHARVAGLLRVIDGEEIHPLRERLQELRAYLDEVAFASLAG